MGRARNEIREEVIHLAIDLSGKRADGPGIGPMGGYLKTLLSYHIPSEAEVDKAYLESQGFTVCLLNANTSRNEWGDAFFVRLQVPEQEFAAARQALWDVNPKRFGNTETVAAIDRQIKRVMLVFLGVAIPAAIGLLLLLPSFGHRWFPLHARRGQADWRVTTALLAAVVLGTLAAGLFSRFERRKSRS